MPALVGAMLSQGPLNNGVWSTPFVQGPSMVRAVQQIRPFDVGRIEVHRQGGIKLACCLVGGWSRGAARDRRARPGRSGQVYSRPAHHILQ